MINNTHKTLDKEIEFANKYKEKCELKTKLLRELQEKQLTKKQGCVEDKKMIMELKVKVKQVEQELTNMDIIKKSINLLLV